MAVVISRTWKTTNMSPLFLEGQTLGKYRVLEPLGRGGMAQVYKAYHPQLDRHVAIKVLRPDLTDEAEFLARFQREARAAAALRHSNIVQVYDFDVQDDLYYMVMELLEGNTLKAHLNAFRTRGGCLALGETVHILCDVLEGLAYAHGEGIIHRDLKPSNILLTRHGQAVLTDFGIAQIVGGTQYTVSGALMGTLNYMAPEQGLHGNCDVRSDIYSLGVVYYEMLTGKVPFDADTPLAIVMKHLNAPVQPPRELNPNIPSPLEEVALKALAKEPSARYQSADEMKQAILTAAQEAGIGIPERVNLPRIGHQATGQGRPVAVFSGPARQRLSDAAFAADDTDVRPRKKLGQSNGFVRLIKGMAETASAIEERIARQKAGAAALYGSAWVALVNMALLWASGVFGWQVLGNAWPAELIAAATLLSALMATLADPWLVIPAGVTLGVGLLLSYSSITGWWTQWIVFWPLVPILTGICIVTAVLLSQQGADGARLTRRLGILLAALSAIAVLPVLVFSILLP